MFKVGDRVKLVKAISPSVFVCLGSLSSRETWTITEATYFACSSREFWRFKVRSDKGETRAIHEDDIECKAPFRPRFWRQDTLSPK